jgi:NADP-dependent 3-hydroxy acid dehydrogenase YdfG
VAVATDVTRRADVAALVATAEAEFGRLDVMVNNAGVGPVSPLDELKVDEWDHMVDVNLGGVLHGIAAALPMFRRQSAGQFVTVGSVAGMTPTPPWPSTAPPRPRSASSATVCVSKPDRTSG